MKRNAFALVLLMAALAQACSRNPAGKVSGPVGTHHFEEWTRDWIIELPQTATSQEVISNYFNVLVLHDGIPVTHNRFEVVDVHGKIVAEKTVPIQRIRRFSVVKEWTGLCPHGSGDEFILDTDIGRKRVRIELAGNHGTNRFATGWRCSISDAPTNTDWTVTP